MHLHPKETETPGVNIVRRKLLAWFKQHARELPWRLTKHPYAIWVSEIMLQQTQVDTVIPYYTRFMQAFPDVVALAQADDDRVMKHWEGLGYYRRVRHLLQAARLIVREHAGEFPQTAETWKQLPGIGEYTAGAIASIAQGEAAPILDGNVKRILSRIFAVPGFLEEAVTVKKLWAWAGALVPRRSPGAFNQAMMELGALVCLPEKPHCLECPVRTVCLARASGNPVAWPRRKPKKVKPHRRVVIGVLQERNRFLIGQRPDGGMLGGLWEFPGGEVEKNESMAQALQREFKEEVGLDIKVGALIGTVEHAYTHFSISLHAFHCQRLKGKPQALYHRKLRWVSALQCREYAFPGANQKILKKLHIV